MAGELIQQALEPLMIHAESMQNSMYSSNAFEGVAEGMANVGQHSYAGVKDALLAVGGVYLVYKQFSKHTGHHGGGEHAKQAEVREVRARVVRVWEGGLLEKNGQFFKSVPVVNEKGEHVVIKGVEQYTEEFYALITPGFKLRSLQNLLRPRTRMILVNHLPDEVDFERVNFKNDKEDVYTLAGGMTCAHVKAQDEHGRPMAYEYLEPSDEKGKTRPAGRISTEKALLNAIMTSASRAETARQLELIARPAVIERLRYESNPDIAAHEPAFCEDVEKAVHDKFLDRGSVLVNLGVNASICEEIEAANQIASAMRERTRILAQSNNNDFTDTNEEQLTGDEEIATVTSRISRSKRTV
jgi:hypothetical protein